jgi:hypothetical protein
VRTQLQRVRARGSRYVVVTILAIGLVTSACSSSRSDPIASRPETPARLQIVDPAPNARTGAHVELTLRLERARLVTPTEGIDVVPDRGHLHISVDGQLVAMPSALQVTVPELTKGAHTISAEFVASDHLPFRNRVVAAVSFRVR